MGRRQADAPKIVWQEERETLTLTDEPVLEYVLSWPEITGGGRGGARISRYYARMCQVWRGRWRRDIYIRACLDMVQRQSESLPFAPWTGSLKGELTLLDGGLLSLRFSAQEVWGDGRPNQVRWGDTWHVQDGTPLTLRQALPGQKGWRKALFSQLRRQGEQRREAGDLFLDRDWAGQARKYLPREDFCLTPEAVELAFPQCALAPAAEGTPVFLLPRPNKEGNFPLQEKN